MVDSNIKVTVVMPITLSDCTGILAAMDIKSVSEYISIGSREYVLV